MNHCPVTADLNRHLNQLDRDEARAESVDEKLAEMMADRKTLAAIIDDVIQDDPYMDIADNGSTNLANDLASLLLAGKDAGAIATAAGPFIATLRQAVEDRMRMDAETEVDHDIAQAEEDAAEAKAEARAAAKEEW